MALILVAAASPTLRLGPSAATDDTGELTVVTSQPPATVPPLPVMVNAGPSLQESAAPPTPERSAGTGATSEADQPFPFDATHIEARRDALFPFLTGRLFFLEELHERQGAEARRLRNPLGSANSHSDLPPLVLTTSELNRLIDTTWSRRDRWKNFEPIADLARTHDPDTGQLPALVHAYVDQNLLQPYVESGSADPRFWTMLDLAADHLDVIEFAGTFIRARPSSRTSIELLFLLDELTQASRDALGALLGTTLDPGLRRTAAASPENLRLAEWLRRAYTAWLRERQLDAPVALARRFDEIRLSILTAIVGAEGSYGEADARFLIGRIYWDRNDVPTALQWWREMRPDDRRSYETVRSEIGGALGPGDRADVIEIVRALGAEYGRWRRESKARLEKFGFTPDTF